MKTPRETLGKYSRDDSLRRSGFSRSPVNPKSLKKKFPQNAISSTLLNTKAPVSLSSLHSGGARAGCGRINGYHSLATSSRNCFYVRARRARGEGKKQEGRRGKILVCIATYTREREIYTGEKFSRIKGCFAVQKAQHFQTTAFRRGIFHGTRAKRTTGCGK